MADEKKADKSAVIRKIKKGGHGGSHGGSWKVAYADFVTAMMAFFLLLWLLAMNSPEKRVAIASYFKEFSIFKESGSSFMAGGKGAVQQTGTESKGETKQPKSGMLSPEEMKEKISLSIQEKLEDLKDQVMIDVIEGGIRIQLVDKEGSRMFEAGSTVPTSKAKKLIALIADNIKETTNRIAIEGHTDAFPYNADGVTNWELSILRASAARQELEKNGIDPYRIARVVGYADTDPLIKYNPRDERNRRISLILLYEKRAGQQTIMRTPEMELNSPNVDDGHIPPVSSRQESPQAAPPSTLLPSANNP